MDERIAFVAAIREGVLTMAELCRQFEISRKTGYKWADRYAAEGPRGLAERSHAPHGHPQALRAEDEARILALRVRYPSWGPKKLRVRLRQEAPGARCPAASTIGAMLSRHGLVVPRRRRLRVPPRSAPFASCQGPNDVWCADFKGWFRTGDGARCEPFTLSDAWSRYLLRCQAVTRTDTATVWPIFDAAFREFGLPAVVRSDNGPPFAGRGAGGLSRLGVRLIKAGVTPERIDPGRPEQNGRHERLHRTLDEDVACPPAATLAAQRRRLAAFRRVYNQERPHEALDQTPPAAHYRASARRYSGRLRSPDYPGGTEVRRVKDNGEIGWRNHGVFLTETLAGEPVGVRAIDDGRWRVSYGPLELGTLTADGTLHKPKSRSGPACGFVDSARALPTTPQAPPPQPQDHKT